MSGACSTRRRIPTRRRTWRPTTRTSWTACGTTSWTTRAARCRCSARPAWSAADVERVEPLQQPDQLHDGRAELGPGVAPAQQVGAQAAHRLAAFVDLDDRVLAEQLVFAGLVLGLQTRPIAQDRCS